MQINEQKRHLVCTQQIIKFTNKVLKIVFILHLKKF